MQKKIRAKRILQKNCVVSFLQNHTSKYNPVITKFAYNEHIGVNFINLFKILKLFGEKIVLEDV